MLLASLSLLVGLAVSSPQAALASSHRPRSAVLCVKLKAGWFPHHPRRDAFDHVVVAMFYLSDCGGGQELVRVVFSVRTPCRSFGDHFLVSLSPRHSKGFGYGFIPYCAGTYRLVAEARFHGVVIDRDSRRVRVV